MSGLLGNTKRLGNLGPRPPLFERGGNRAQLQFVSRYAKGDNGGKSLFGVGGLGRCFEMRHASMLVDNLRIVNRC
jgi:hypothetical protein